MSAGIGIFLDLTGPSGPVAGSCTDEQFKGKIELESFVFNVAPVPRTRTRAVAPVVRKVEEKEGEEKKKAKRKDDSLTIVKVIDASSATLLAAYCKHLQPEIRGQEFKKAVVTCRLLRGGAPFLLLVLTFTGLHLIDYQLEGVDGKTTHPTEKLSFSYRTVTIQYTREPASPSEAASPRSVSWDRTARQSH